MGRDRAEETCPWRIAMEPRRFTRYVSRKPVSRGMLHQYYQAGSTASECTAPRFYAVPKDPQEAVRERRLGINLSSLGLSQVLQSSWQNLDSIIKTGQQPSRSSGNASALSGSDALQTAWPCRLAARAPPPGSYTLPSFFDDVDRQRQAGMCRF